MFVRPLREGFVGMAIFTWLREDESPPLDVVGHVAVEYEPAQQFLAALTGTEISGLALKEPTVAVKISSVSEASKGAEELGRFVSGQVPALGQLADVDVVIELLGQRRVVPFEVSKAAIYAMNVLDPGSNASELPDAKDVEGRLILALLVGAGRHEEARRALAEYDLMGSELASSPREYRRFVRQVTRLLDMGRGFSLPTTSPRWPARPVKPEPPQSFRQVFAERRPVARARQDAVKTVRGISEGKTRDELRTLLTRELDQHEVSMDQGSFDATVDFLTTERKRFGGVRVGIRALQTLWKLGSSSPKQPEIIRDSPPDYVEGELEQEPSWLVPPDRAAYPIWSVGERMVAVELDSAAQAQLAGVMQVGSSDIRDTRFVEVWFAWDDQPPVTSSRLSVYVGSQRVGRLDVDASEHFRPAMEAAADRDEDPWMIARLKKKGSGGMPYVLEIALPEPCED